MYDTIIIGGGPAGMTAAIYTARRKMKTLILSVDLGGQITKTNEIENYPGFEMITGAALATKFYDQAKSFGTEFIFDEVKHIEKFDDGFHIKGLKTTYKTKTVILAFGKKPSELGVPGEEELKGRGVSYCATCDAPFYKDKTVAVVGSGSSALNAILESAKVAKKVYSIVRSDGYKGEQVLIDEIKALKNLEIHNNCAITKIEGKNKVEKIVCDTGAEMLLDGVLIEIGYMIDRKLIKDLVKTDEKDQVIIDNMQNTSVSGIFAAGDLTNTPYKQIAISTGEGTKAALSAAAYIQKLKAR
jgi:thioredoxin reductase (NADPH)